MTTKVVALLALAGLAVVAVPFSAGAEEGAPVEDPGHQSGSSPRLETRGIDQIVITGRRREESLLTAPLAVTSFSEEDLVDNNFTSLDEIDRLVPNVKFDRTDGSSQIARIFVRGVGQSDSLISDDPGVGVYVDGVYIPRLQGALLDIVDVQSIEVLRGPQGTLYGKNAIGGAINVVSRKPGPDFDVSARLRAGNRNAYESRVMLNVPIVAERAFARISLATATDDGYSRNVIRDSPMDDKKLLGGRASLLFTPTDSVEVNVSAERVKRHQAPTGGECRVIHPSVRLLTLFEQGIGPMAGVGKGVLQAACNASEAFRYRANQKPSNKLDTEGVAARIVWEVDPRNTLTLIESWRGLTTRINNDLDQTELSYVEIFALGGRQTALSHELQWNGATAGEKLRWTAGVYLGRDLAEAGSLTLAAPDLTNTSIVPDQSNHFEIEVNNLTYAVFGQLLFDPADWLHVTMGIRNSRERKELEVHSFREFSRARLVDADSAKRFRNLSPMASVSVDLAEGLSGYLTYSEGWRSGGFNGRAVAPGALLPFDQERLTSSEIGFKGTLLERRLQFSIAFFRSMYDDVQVTVFGSNASGMFTSQVRNAAKAQITGLEAELQLRPIDDLTLEVVGGLTDARFLEFNDVSPQTGQRIDRSDRNFQDVPPFNLDLLAEYQIHLDGMGTLVPRLSWFVQGRIEADAPNTDVLAQGKIGLMDARVAWRLPDGHTELALWGKNLLNRRYRVGGVSFADGVGLATRYYGPPRSYGLELSWHFD